MAVTSTKSLQSLLARRHQLLARRRPGCTWSLSQCLPGHPTALEQTDVGLVTTFSGLLGLAAQTPIGAMIDETRAKRGAIVLALAVLAFGATLIFALPTFWPVMIANSLMAVVGDVFGPAVAALTLGLYVRKQFARRMGRNSAFDHAGNVAIAVAAGAVGYAFSLMPTVDLIQSSRFASLPQNASGSRRLASYILRFFASSAWA